MLLAKREMCVHEYCAYSHYMKANGLEQGVGTTPPHYDCRGSYGFRVRPCSQMVTVLPRTAEGPGSNPGSAICIEWICYRINLLGGHGTIWTVCAESAVKHQPTLLMAFSEANYMADAKLQMPLSVLSLSTVTPEQEEREGTLLSFTSALRRQYPTYFSFNHILILLLLIPVRYLAQKLFER